MGERLTKLARKIALSSYPVWLVMVLGIMVIFTPGLMLLGMAVGLHTAAQDIVNTVNPILRLSHFTEQRRQDAWEGRVFLNQ